MERKKLLEELESGNLKQIYLIYGKETFLIEEIQEKFKTLVNPAMMDFNLSVIDGKETNLEEFRSSIETLPFMDERRYIIVKDFELLKGKKKNFTDSDEKELIKALENISATTVLLFINYGDIDKRKAIYKAINKLGRVCEMKKLDDMSLLNWCKRQFDSRKVKISNSDVTYFIETTGYRDRTSEMTLNDVEQEIIKLCSYVGDEEAITKDIIRNLMNSRVENDIFQLIDMIGSKNAKRSYKILTDMIESGESILGIFAMLSKQFNHIMQVKSLQEERMPHNLIKDTLKMHPYTFNKVVRQARNYDEDNLLSIVNYISDYDYKIKQGLMEDSLAAEILIAKYCR
ncbi:DNA polymerase III subunit delta [Peptostreptococcus russellii]|uniref:DNA polymerase III subunit delta n=1 Tax=Peptostreptococcus russellii TaxID=215200 RepID=A0A1H8FEI3_9FIRM|nr:DNA polymerase III subunit delta [Peptostreptococcus russellii]SEN29894.1 DNA polymerase III, delta subunit [Peptostreptococcus russellii]